MEALFPPIFELYYSNSSPVPFAKNIYTHTDTSLSASASLKVRARIKNLSTTEAKINCKVLVSANMKKH